MKLRKFLILTLLVSSISLLVLSMQGRTQVASDKLNNFFEPVVSAMYRLGNGSEAKADSTSLELLELEQLKLENQSLRSLLNFAEKSKYTFVGADVSSIKTDGVKRQIVISRGKTAGIAEGMAVVADGYLIGKVTSVSEDYSLVELVTDPEFRASGMIVESESVGLLRGSSGSGIVLDKVAAYTEPTAGDTVITSALGGSLPKGIPIGEIVATSSDPNSVFISARISLPVDFNSLQTVLVITDE